jgi:lysophospholipase
MRIIPLCCLLLVLPAVFSQGTLPPGNVYNYAPTFEKCPTTKLVRNASEGLSQDEQTFLMKRRQKIAVSFRKYLENVDIPGFDVAKFFELAKSDPAILPVLAMAISGGGYTSAYNGAALFNSLDDRNPSARAAKIGGISNSLTYFAGLSGGSNPTVSLPANNWTLVSELAKNVWKTNIDTFARGDTEEEVANYENALFEAIGAKYAKGFPVGSADLLGRAFSYEFLGTENNGSVSSHWSDIRNYDWMKNGDWPYPMVLLTEVIPLDPTYNGVAIPLTNASIYESGPFEWGSWNGRASYFIDTKYIGTAMSDGRPINSSSCVVGFDNTGFQIGTSSAAASFWYLQNMTNGEFPQFAKRNVEATTLYNTKLNKRAPVFPASTLDELLDIFPEYFNTSIIDALYAYYPNPFQDLNPSLKNVSTLKMVDGSLSGQTIPLWSLLWPERKVDLIVAFDASAETPNSWQNGTNLIDTANAAHAAGIPFPEIADANTILERKYNENPTFFGCSGSPGTPMVLYVSNSPWTTYSNISYVTGTSIPEEEFNGFLKNSLVQMTLAHSQNHEDWPTCLACMTLKKPSERANMSWPSGCTKCLAKYCWDGTNSTSTYSLPYNPTIITTGETFEAWNASLPSP